MDARQLISKLRSLGNPASVEGMARYGINPERAFGVSIPSLREIAKQTGRNNTLLAVELWSSGIHEARILASMIANPDDIRKSTMKKWAYDFNSWDLCDQCCNNLFVYTPHARELAVEWSGKSPEFVKRAGFVLMAVIAVHRKELNNDDFDIFLERIAAESDDGRNFVKKAVNWALRQIGKRNIDLNSRAVETANRILERESKTAGWIASNALSELTNSKIKSRFRND